MNDPDLNCKEGLLGFMVQLWKPRLVTRERDNLHEDQYRSRSRHATKVGQDRGTRHPLSLYLLERIKSA